MTLIDADRIDSYIGIEYDGKEIEDFDDIPTISESEIVKPYLEKLSEEIAEAREEYDDYDPHSLGLFEERVQDLIDDLLKGEAE